MGEVPTWDEIWAKVPDIPDLSQDEVTAIQAALKYLEQELKDSFLTNLYRVKHPVSMMFWANEVAWTRRWTYWFATWLKLVSRSEGYDRFRKRIRDPKCWDELAPFCGQG